MSSMADRSPDRDRDRDRGGDIGRHRVPLTRHPPEGRYGVGTKSGPSTTKILVVLAMLPAGGTLLALAGITLVGTLVGLAVTTPLLILFSPVLVPAAIVVGLAVTGLLTSGAFGLTAVAALLRVISYIRQGSRSSVPGGLEWAESQARDTAGYLGHKTKEVGQQIQGKASRT